MAVAATVLNVFLLSMAAYVIARFQWKADLFPAFVFCGAVDSGAALLQPLYQTMIAMGLYDSLIGLILVYIAFGLPTTIYVMSSYFMTIPKGWRNPLIWMAAGFFKTFSLIVIPIVKPALGTAAVLEFWWLGMSSSSP